MIQKCFHFLLSELDESRIMSSFRDVLRDTRDTQHSTLNSKHQTNTMPKASFQVFTDRNTKIIPSSGNESSGGSSGGKIQTERVQNVAGSVAGAGSGEFHNYLNTRKRERERVEEMEKTIADDEERKAFQAKVEANKKEAEEKTKKNAAKRQKKKEKRKLRRKLENGKEVECKSSDEESDGEKEPSTSNSGEGKEESKA